MDEATSLKLSLPYHDGIVTFTLYGQMTEERGRRETALLAHRVQQLAWKRPVQREPRRRIEAIIDENLW